MIGNAHGGLGHRPPRAAHGGRGRRPSLARGRRGGWSARARGGQGRWPARPDGGLRRPPAAIAAEEEVGLLLVVLAYKLSAPAPSLSQSLEDSKFVRF